MIDDDGFAKDAPELFEKVHGDVWKKHGAAEGILDPSDLYIEKFGAGQWIVMSKTKGNVPLGSDIRVDLRTLSAKRQEVEADHKVKREAARQEDVVKRKAARDVLLKDLEEQRKTVERWEKQGHPRRGRSQAPLQL